ncbi:hypothetical protein [Microbulbifer spongiae]|uniref:Uncharacterized protein n=1 Tax=Microbulbifer spongiae TaxID=2944933 RepID=A0ABY9EA67_9GAMM|nr:hypothetical protein [Microbulbifer sp. MI-G]WKD49918.1 hypothetical protein M8T91_00365 [Microbulbifer sp. MI-G]
MNLRYLCANHRQWLIADTDRAEKTWLDWIELGKILSEEGNEKEAIPYLGCAFDLAGFLLAKQWPSYAVSATRFSENALCLMAAYRELGDEKLHRYILAGASSILARQLGDGLKQRIAADCISALYPTGVGDAMQKAAQARWPVHLDRDCRLH